MDSSGFSALIRQAYPDGPIVAVLVPEDRLKELTLAARTVVFETASPSLPHGMVAASNIAELDRVSQLFADVLDLDSASEARDELRRTAVRVRDWIDAGCITLPPVHAIRALVESAL